MARPCSSRTPRWPDNTGRTGRGSVTIVVILLMLVFAGLGLAMLQASGVHMKINAFRRSALLLDCASENGLKRGLHDLSGWLESRGHLAAAPEAGVEAVRADPAAGFPALLEAALGSPFPRTLEESFDGLLWESRADCAFARLEDRGPYLRIEAALTVESRGGLLTAGTRRLSRLEGALGLLAGRLPLAAVPLYIKGGAPDGDAAGFLGENGIRLVRRPGALAGTGMAAATDGVLPDDPGPLAAEALRVGVFRPGDLSPAALRAALGLEPSTERVPDGVYLIANDLGLGGVFVMGDIDEMVLAVDGDTQVVVFRARGAEWRLDFSPARSRTSFRTPGGERAYDLVPLPLVIVDGAVLSLGGGAVLPDGSVALAYDGETPAVLDGVDLTIVSSAAVTISSHLVLEGVRWRDGVPYAKDTRAQLVIYSSGRDVATGEAVEGGIVVAAGAPSGLRVQATMTAASGGFRVEGSGKTVEVMGALHADGYSGAGNALLLAADDRAAAGELPGRSPLTASSQLAFYAFRVLAWREY